MVDWMASGWKPYDPCCKSELFVWRKLLAMVLNFSFRSASIEMLNNRGSRYSSDLCCSTDMDKGHIFKSSQCIFQFLLSGGAGNVSIVVPLHVHGLLVDVARWLICKLKCEMRNAIFCFQLIINWTRLKDTVPWSNFLLLKEFTFRITYWSFAMANCCDGSQLKATIGPMCSGLSHFPWRGPISSEMV